MTNATKSQGPQKLSVQEIQNLREQTREYEEVLNNVDGLSTGLQNSGSISRLVNKNRSILQRDEGLIAKGRSKDVLAREIKQIEETIAEHRPTRSMMEAKPGTSEFEKAVRMNLEFTRKYSPLMVRLKDLKRRLEPDDPSAGNLERIRKA